MNTAILLVTWFAFNQAPASYQTVFKTLDACEAAQIALYDQRERLKAQTANPPSVTATCVLAGAAPRAVPTATRSQGRPARPTQWGHAPLILGVGY